MDLILKLIENQQTDETIRLICESIRSNRQFITIGFILLFLILVSLEIVNLVAMHRLEKRLRLQEKISEKPKKDLQ